MDGIEILNQEIIYNTILPEYFCGIGWIVGMVFIIVMIMCFVNDRIITGFICLVLVFGSLVVSILGSIPSKSDINYIKYKCTIDNSVSITEFLDKYEILDQEGKIYTIKERE